MEEDEDVMNYDEEFGVIPNINIAGVFIREYIILNGPSSAWRIYRAWREFRRRQGHKGPSYQSFWRNYIWPLKKLGLLTETSWEEEAEYRGTIPPKPLAILGPEDHPAWYDPMGYMYGGSQGVRKRRTKPGTGSVERLVSEFTEAMARGIRKYSGGKTEEKTKGKSGRKRKKTTRRRRK